MNIFYKVLGLLVMASTISVQAADILKHEVTSAWRQPHFAHTNVEMNKNCNDICRRKGQDWTTNWSHAWWQGQKCECKNRPKLSWLLFGKEAPTPVDIEYRPSGAISNSHELQESCTRKCEDHGEKYTGAWKHKFLRGYLCECKKTNP